jgi:hypothetical protein
MELKEKVWDNVNWSELAWSAAERLLFVIKEMDFRKFPYHVFDHQAGF